MFEHTRRPQHGWAVLSSLVVALATGCADDSPVTTASQGDSTTSGDTDTSPITFADTGSTTVVADDTATGSTGSTGTTGSTGSTGGTDSTTGDTETTGEPAIPGRTMNQLVTAGERTSSPNYTLVYTFGQPSSLQSTHQSTNYRIQGGLIGANGSPP